MSDKKNSFWLIWNPQGDAPTRQHQTRHSATVEAERLARLNRGRRFIVLQSVGECVVDDVRHFEHEPEDEHPF